MVPKCEPRESSWRPFRPDIIKALDDTDLRCFELLMLLTWYSSLPPLSGA